MMMVFDNPRKRLQVGYECFHLVYKINTSIGKHMLPSDQPYQRLLRQVVFDDQPKQKPYIRLDYLIIFFLLSWNFTQQCIWPLWERNLLFIHQCRGSSEETDVVP